MQYLQHLSTMTETGGKSGEIGSNYEQMLSSLRFSANGPDMNTDPSS